MLNRNLFNLFLPFFLLNCGGNTPPVSQETENTPTQPSLSPELEKINLDLTAAEALLNENKLGEAAQALQSINSSLELEKQKNLVATEPFINKYDALIVSLDQKNHEKDLNDWLTIAQSIVQDPTKCGSKSIVTSFMEITLSEQDLAIEKIKTMHDQLQACADSASPWAYITETDPMGRSVWIAAVESQNTVTFDFPYQGEQKGMLVVRHKEGELRVQLRLEKGQFMCSFRSCSLLVKFDEAPPVKWSAAEPASHATNLIFLNKEAAFIKNLSKAKEIRIEATFFRQGTRTFIFPVAGFEFGKIQ